VLPRDSTAGGPGGKYILGCKDHSIQVWNSATLTYHSTLPTVSQAARKFGSKQKESQGSQTFRGGKSQGKHDGSQPERGPGQGEEGGAPVLGRGKTQGHPLTALAYNPTNRQILVSTMDKYVSIYAPAFRQYQLVDSFACHNTPQCMTVNSLHSVTP
jgi:WD40 repeat protein